MITGITIIRETTQEMVLPENLEIIMKEDLTLGTNHLQAVIEITGNLLILNTKGMSKADMIIQTERDPDQETIITPEVENTEVAEEEEAIDMGDIDLKEAIEGMLCLLIHLQYLSNRMICELKWTKDG